MKKIIGIIILLMLMVSISSLALAEDAEENLISEPGFESTSEIDNNETVREVIIMNYSLGSKIRLLQLEKAITRNLLKGEMAVDVLEGLEYNTTNLEEILDELELVLEQVKNADPNASDAVEVFVGLKHDSKNLTTLFRNTIKDMLSEVKYKEIRQQIRENLSDELQNYSKKIQNQIKQFNRNQLYRLYGIVGQGNNSVVTSYMNGTMNLTQVKLQLNKMVNMKAQSKKKEIFGHIKKENIQNQASANALANKVKANFTERKQDRLQQRLEKANETGNTNLMEKIQERINQNQNNQGNSGKGSQDNGNEKGNNSNENNGSGNTGKGKGK